MRGMVAVTFSELLFAVLFGHFHLEHLIFTDVGGDLGQTLSPRAPDTDEKHVPSELTDHTNHTGYWGKNTKKHNRCCKLFTKFLIHLVLMEEKSRYTDFNYCSDGKLCKASADI